MDIPSIIDHNYYIVRATKTNKVWICEAERFDDKDSKLYYYYGTYELSSDEHKNNCYLSNSYYDILPSENDEVRLATMEEIDILMDILEKNGIVITLQEAKDKAKAPDLKGEDYSNKRFGYKIPDGYEFDVVVDGKIFIKPIKSKYPTSYEECCKMLGISYRVQLSYTYPEVECSNIYLTKEKHLLDAFMKLRICRNAYWKIAGEEMGLGKSWKPEWNWCESKFCIGTIYDEIEKFHAGSQNCMLAFPTEEMRDAFYENFKELIEECKELL